jgi:hypothetical protein
MGKLPASLLLLLLVVVLWLLPLQHVPGGWLPSHHLVAVLGLCSVPFRLPLLPSPCPVGSPPPPFLFIRRCGPSPVMDALRDRMKAMKSAALLLARKRLRPASSSIRFTAGAQLPRGAAGGSRGLASIMADVGAHVWRGAGGGMGGAAEVSPGAPARRPMHAVLPAAMHP